MEEETRMQLRSKRYYCSSIILLCLATIGQLACARGSAEDNKPEIAAYRTAAAILALSPDKASHGDSAQIRGVVTQSVEQGMVINDSTAGIWIYWDQSENYSPGDELEVRGVVATGMFAPVVNAVSIRKLGRSALPKPANASFRQLSSGDMDGQYVTVAGSVRSVGIRNTGPRSKRLSMKVQVDGGFLLVTLPAEDQMAVSALIDAVVRITGTAMCSKNDSRQIIAPTLAVSDLHNITVLRARPSNLFSEPLIPIGRLMQYRSGTDFDHRVHVAGTVTYYQPGESLILEDHGAALNIKTTQSISIALGDRVEAVGFPAPQDSGPILEDALLRRISTGPPLAPMPVKLADISSGKLNYNLISTEGRLLRQMREPSREVFLLQENSNILLAELESSAAADVLHKIPEGSAIRISGISTLEIGGPWNYGVDSAKAVRCRILLRSPSDLVMIEPPTWWTTRHVVYIAIGLGIFAVAFLIQIIRSLVERWRLQAVLAERERLAHEIHDTLAQSFAGIGFQLQAIRRAIPGDLSDLQQQVDLARDLVRHSHKEARRSIEPLHSELAETADLLLSLENSARRMVEGGSVEIVAVASGSRRPLPARITDTLLRIGQEAIANAIRHADPSRLTIALLYKKDSVTLSIQDDGIGFVKSGDLLGFGLRGMRRRAAMISANLEIMSQPGSGTCITTTVHPPPPLTPAALLRSFWSYITEHLSHAYTE